MKVMKTERPLAWKARRSLHNTAVAITDNLGSKCLHGVLSSSEYYQPQSHLFPKGVSHNINAYALAQRIEWYIISSSLSPLQAAVHLIHSMVAQNRFIGDPYFRSSSRDAVCRWGTGEVCYISLLRFDHDQKQKGRAKTDLRGDRGGKRDSTNGR